MLRLSANLGNRAFSKVKSALVIFNGISSGIFVGGELSVKPSQGRALIKEPLGRFLEQQDYQLEPGGDYAFTIRAEL